jgi:hypothetical protein
MAITIGGVARSAADADTPAVDSVEVNNRPPSNNDMIKEDENLRSPGAVQGHINLVLPSLCQRYEDLPLSLDNWFEELLATRDSKRRHCKSHGLIPFADLARIIATNYREIDHETKAFVNEVALQIALYNHDLESKEMKECEDRMGLTQKEMKARQQQEMEVGKKTSLNGAMSTMVMTQLPPRMVHSATMMPRTLTASAIPSTMGSYDFELARLQREAEMAAFARIKLEQQITQLRMQYHYQLRLQEQLRSSRQHHELLNILHRENHLLTTNNTTGIMSNIMGRVVPSGASILPSEDNVDIRRRILGVIPEVVDNDLLREK